MIWLSAGAGARRKERTTGQLPPSKTVTLGPPTHAGSSLPGLVQMLAQAQSPRKQAVMHVQWSQQCALLHSGPQVLGAPSPQTGDLFCPLSAARDMTAPRWGSERQAQPRTPQALSKPPRLAKCWRLWGASRPAVLFTLLTSSLGLS